MAKLPTKTPKLPKSLGACVDLYSDTRTARLAEGKVVAVMEEQEKLIRNHIIDNLPKDEGGAVGKRYKGVTYNDVVYQVEDWDKFYAHLKKTGEFDLLNRALNQAAVKERIDAQQRPNGKRGDDWKPKLPPGVRTFTVVKLSVTKL